MNATKQIAILGLGNVGTHLARRLTLCGFHVTHLISTSGTKADELASEINANVLREPEAMDDQIDIVFLCVPDDVIPGIVQRLPPAVKVVHCSGSTPLIERPKGSGVLYMFQTFSSGTTLHWDGLPIFIEATNDILLNRLNEIGKALSGNVTRCDSEHRKLIHIAGVFGSNFVNHILYLAEQVLKRGDLQFQVLEPLLRETMRKAMQQGPEASQTGPARRGDAAMIAEHIAMLGDGTPSADIYRLISASIQNTYDT